jgi:AcrR family transcriptional regulator
MVERTRSPQQPKQARAVATRQKLLEATVSSLCEVGYARTTTTEIAGRAGVSQGALYRHFVSKHQLIAETTRHLFAWLIDRFKAGFTASSADDDKLSRVMRELWAVFTTQELHAVLELYVAARTDEHLRQALVPVVLLHRMNLIAEARALFPEAAAANPRFESLVDGLLSAVQGAALTAALLPEVPVGDQVLQYLEHVCRPELEPPFGES